jgi:hypothetical protein
MKTNNSIISSEEAYKKLFKFAEKTGLVKNGKYIDGIPNGTNENVDLFYYWEDFLGYPSVELVNSMINK